MQTRDFDLKRSLRRLSKSQPQISFQRRANCPQMFKQNFTSHKAAATDMKSLIPKAQPGEIFIK